MPRIRETIQKFVDPDFEGLTAVLSWLFVLSLVVLSVSFTVAIGAAIFGRDFGQFGDFFGGTANPILTFLTFMGLLITIILQQSELKETRLELKRSADALEMQIGSIKLQNFENTFFQMLSLHNKIVDSMDVHRRTSGTLHGRDCFRHFATQLQSRYDHGVSPQELDRILIAHGDFWQLFQQDLAHYYRYLYNIIRLVDESDVLDKVKYVRILRAQLSDYELLILFYNGLTPRARKFKTYIEKYELFDNLPVERLFSSAHRSFYSPGAYEAGSVAYDDKGE